MIHHIIIVDFCGCIVRFELSSEENHFSNYHWKLDPYRVKSHGNKHDNFGKEDIEFVVDLYDSKTLIMKTAKPDSSLLYSELSGFYIHEVYQLKTKEYIWLVKRGKNNELMLAFTVSDNWQRIALNYDNTEKAGAAAFEYLGRIMRNSLVFNQILCVHSALIEYRNEGILICAPSGTGKTTHARNWRDYNNAIIINGDMAACKKENEKWFAYGLPWSGTSGEQIRRHVPLKAIVLLERGTHNTVTQIHGLQAFTGMLPLIHSATWDLKNSTTALDLYQDMLSDIPVYLLSCLPDSDAVDLLEKEVWK